MKEDIKQVFLFRIQTFFVSRIKSNLSSPYDDDVVPGIPGHLPVLGICFLCVSVSVYMFPFPKPYGPTPLTNPMLPRWG